METCIICLVASLLVFSAKQSETARTIEIEELLEKEIGYKLQGKLHSKQTGYDGDSLVIGAPPDIVLSVEEIKRQYDEALEPKSEHNYHKPKPGIDPWYKCMKLSAKHKFEDSYEIRVMKRSTKSYELTAEETRSPVLLSEYFVHISKELFECTDPEKKLPESLKIVNKLMSIKEIYEIKYHDGVEVSSISHLGDDRRVKIVETKYLYTNTSGVYTMLYEGESEQCSIELGKHLIPDFKKEHILYKEQKTKESWWSPEIMSGHLREWSTVIDMPRIVGISDSGKSLKLGYNRKKIRKSYNKQIFTCQEVQGVNPFPPMFRPECYQQIENSNKILFAEVSDQDFSKMFTFVKREVWLCTTEVQEQEGTNKVESFLRVVTEVIGRTRVKTVEYENGLTSLYSISIPDGVSIRFSTLGYFDPNTRELVSGDVALKLVEPEKPRINRLNTGKSKCVEINFALSPSTVYRTLISTEGYDLRVGKRSLVKLGTPNDVFRCNRAKNFDNNFPITFKIKMKKDGMHKIQEIDGQKESKYFRYINREAYFCDHHKGSFHRVVNRIELLVPVHEIETVDGVELFHTLLDNNKKSVNIVETKYVKCVSQIHQMVVGKFHLSDFNERFETYYDAISKSIEETIPEIGHSPKRIIVDRDVDPNWDPQHYNMLSIGKGHDVITFNVDPENKMDDKNDIVDCEWTNTKPINLFPRFRVSNEEKCKSGAGAENCKSLLSSTYFEKDVSEVWTCKKMGKDIFLRIVTEQYLKKSAYTEIGEVKFTDMDRVWIEVENDAGFVVKRHGIRYLTNGDNYRPVNYLGHLVFEEKPRSGEWQSGTKIFLNDVDNPIRELEFHEAVKDTNYNLDHQKKYVCIATSHDVANYLEIGSKWKDIFGTRDSIIHCQIHQKKDGVVDKKYRTKIFVSNIMHEQVENYVFENYFENLKQEIWKCNDQHGNNIFRVLNQLTLQKSPEKLDIKHIYYYDGVTVLWGAEQDSQIQIIEVKYLDPRYSTVLKFEGRVELTGTDVGDIGVTEVLKSARDLVKLDVHYLLGENEVYKRVINSKGIILEVGNKDFQATSRVTSREMTCKRNKEVDVKEVDRLVPRVVMNVFSHEKGDFMSVVLPNSKEIEKLFEFSYAIWDCKFQKTFRCQRVVNKLKLRKDIQVAQIYHFENIIVNNLDDDVYIEEIKFVEKSGSIIIFKGVVTFEGEESIDESHLHKLGEPFRDFLYFLDTETVYLANPSSSGITVEVGTHSRKEFKNDNNQVVTCEKSKERAYVAAFGTSVFTDVYTTADITDDNNYLWVEMNDKMKKHVFEYVDQDVWECSIEGKLEFYRVVNNLFISRKMTRIYYPDGVTVRSLVFPDKSTGTQITEVKYIEPGTNKVLKYDGELKIQANDVVDRLIEIPPKSEKLNIVPLRDALWEETNPFRHDEPPKHYTLDALRVYSLRKANAESSNGIIQGIAYSGKFLTTVFTNSGHRRFKIGSHWNEVFTTKGRTMRCLLDEWNTSYRLRYIPRVMEYVDDNLYELDEDGLVDIFKINKMKLWICTNEMDTILRVETVLYGKIPIYSIRHHDGVNVFIFELQPGEKSVQVTETVYIDPKTSKLLKYEGDLEQTTRASEGILKPLDSFILQTTKFFQEIGSPGGIRKAWNKIKLKRKKIG